TFVAILEKRLKLLQHRPEVHPCGVPWKYTRRTSQDRVLRAPHHPFVEPAAVHGRCQRVARLLDRKPAPGGVKERRHGTTPIGMVAMRLRRNRDGAGDLLDESVSLDGAVSDRGRNVVCVEYDRSARIVAMRGRRPLGEALGEGLDVVWTGTQEG